MTTWDGCYKRHRGVSRDATYAYASLGIMHGHLGINQSTRDAWYPSTTWCKHASVRPVNKYMTTPLGFPQFILGF